MADEPHFSERPLKPPFAGGRYCIVSNAITILHQSIGYMYRVEPADARDSGWVFLSDNESPDYLDDPANFQFRGIDEIMSLDPRVIPFVDAPIGSAMRTDPESRQLEPDFEPEHQFAGPRRVQAQAIKAGQPKVNPGWSLPLEDRREMPTPADGQTDHQFCENCGGPLEFGEVEYRSKTETTVWGGVAGQSAYQVALCPKCAGERDETSDRMIWGIRAFVGIVVFLGLASWLLSALFR